MAAGHSPSGSRRRAVTRMKRNGWVVRTKHDEDGLTANVSFFGGQTAGTDREHRSTAALERPAPTAASGRPAPLMNGSCYPGLLPGATRPAIRRTTDDGTIQESSAV